MGNLANLNVNDTAMVHSHALPKTQNEAKRTKNNISNILVSGDSSARGVSTFLNGESTSGLGVIRQNANLEDTSEMIKSDSTWFWR